MLQRDCSGVVYCRYRRLGLRADNAFQGPPTLDAAVAPAGPRGEVGRMFCCEFSGCSAGTLLMARSAAVWRSAALCAHIGSMDEARSDGLSGAGAAAKGN